jgi:competence protein ComEC
VAASAFWLGLLLGEAVGPRLGGVFLAVGLGAGCAAAISGWSRALLSRRMLEAAGLGTGAPPPAGARERILAAAGLPIRDEASGATEGPRRAAAMILAFLVAGAGWGGLRGAELELGPIESRYVAFRGRAATDIRRYEWGWALEARLESVTLDGRAWPVDLRAWIGGSADGMDAEAGQRLRGEGRLEPLGAGGFSDYLASRGVEVRIPAASLEVLAGGESPPLAAANAVRRGLREGLDRVLPERASGLLLGLSIGDTSRLDPETEEDFRATGLSHLLAVSGSNVATFLAPVLLVAARLGARPGWRSAAGAIAVVFFALLTRWEPSVLRASAMACIALVGLASGRPRSTGPALGAAVLVLLVADPGLVGSVGFELSVAATAGIALMAGPISSRLRALPRPLALAISATVAAQAAVTPLLLLRFGLVPLVTLLTNVLAFPAVAPALLIGVPAAMIGLPWPALGRLLGKIAAVPLDYLIGVADRTARFPLPTLTTEGPAAPVVVAALVALAAWRLRRGRRPVAALISVVAVAAAAWAVPLRGSEPALTATFLDVGQGDSAVVRSPGGATLLIDAGPDEDAVATDLARLGVRRVDLAVATHAHTDHVAGFPAVLARFPVSLLLEPGCPADSPIYERFLDSVENEEVRVEHPRGGDRFTLADVTVEVLGPDACSTAGEPNDDSIVMRVSSGGHTILFTGDAEVPAQQDMVGDGDPLQADVLKVPHHGGDTSDAAFLESTGARVAVISVGQNTYGHPSLPLLETLEAAGMAVYRTDRAGDVTVRFTDEGGVVVGSTP